MIIMRLLTQTYSYCDECRVENEIEKQHKKCIKEDHLTFKKKKQNASIKVVHCMLLIEHT